MRMLDWIGIIGSSLNTSHGKPEDSVSATVPGIGTVNLSGRETIYLVVTVIALLCVIYLLYDKTQAMVELAGIQRIAEVKQHGEVMGAFNIHGTELVNHNTTMTIDHLRISDRLDALIYITSLTENEKARLKLTKPKLIREMEMLR